MQTSAKRARLNKCLFNILLNSKLWEPEPTDYFPLTDDQMELFIKGYYPDWDCRYAPYFINGWFFIARSGHWLKKFRYQKDPSDGLYHVVEHYTTPMVKGTNLLPEVLLYGYYERRIVDHRNDTLLKMK